MTGRGQNVLKKINIILSLMYENKKLEVINGEIISQNGSNFFKH